MNPINRLVMNPAMRSVMSAILQPSAPKISSKIFLIVLSLLLFSVIGLNAFSGSASGPVLPTTTSVVSRVLFKKSIAPRSALVISVFPLAMKLLTSLTTRPI